MMDEVQSLSSELINEATSIHPSTHSQFFLHSELCWPLWLPLWEEAGETPTGRTWRTWTEPREASRRTTAPRRRSGTKHNRCAYKWSKKIKVCILFIRQTELLNAWSSAVLVRHLPPGFDLLEQSVFCSSAGLKAKGWQPCVKAGFKN